MALIALFSPDSTQNGGSAAISSMTNFTSDYIESIWVKLPPNTST